MNRCKNTGIEHSAPFLNMERSRNLRKQVDAFIDRQHAKWNETIPFARHFEGTEVHRQYYARHLIETAHRIRLLRVAESKALAEIAKRSPMAAQVWANYESEEMIHDKLFLDDLAKMGVSKEEALGTEPYLSTKLLAGFFSYLLDHEGPMGVVAYSYLVEYINVKIDPSKISAMKKSLGESNIKGQIAHTHTDATDDHPGEVWEALRYLINSEEDIRSLYQYLEEHQAILGMYFKEIYKDTVLNAEAAA